MHTYAKSLSVINSALILNHERRYVRVARSQLCWAFSACMHDASLSNFALRNLYNKGIDTISENSAGIYSLQRTF
jgi:hypothetical protein